MAWRVSEGPRTEMCRHQAQILRSLRVWDLVPSYLGTGTLRVIPPQEAKEPRGSSYSAMMDRSSQDRTIHGEWTRLPYWHCSWTGW